MRAINICISRFLKMGIDGLINKPKPGRPRIVKDKIIEILENPHIGDESFYTAETLLDEIAKQTLERSKSKKIILILEVL